MILSVLLSLSAFASIGDWQCKALGYDQFNMRRVVSSGRHIVIWEAERAALGACKARGLTSCRVFECANR